jgi:hypothetical protein
MNPVLLSHSSKIAREIESNNRPWNRFALRVFCEPVIKNHDKKIPWMTPRKIHTSNIPT